MIIWTRWGFLVFLALLVGALLGSMTLSPFGVTGASAAGIAMMFWYGSLISLALTLWVFPRLDKPQMAMITRPLAQPIIDENGRKQKSETVPVLDPEGNPVFYKPSSTLFFIPARFYWIIFGTIALLPTAEWIFRR